MTVPVKLASVVCLLSRERVIGTVNRISPPGPALERAVAYVLGRPGIFLNTSSDATLLRATLEAASDPRPVPSDAELDQDARDHEMAPIFDGAELERI